MIRRIALMEDIVLVIFQIKRGSVEVIRFLLSSDRVFIPMNSTAIGP